ncbi:MAG TPA: flagellar hook-associated protein FlgL [Limnobacter sp.]|uniref:flagellar hook-associated protein FlgL n=1 Tax=Limnobacter sp. TaxID=2003368 RepID=UPI002ED913C8
MAINRVSTNLYYSITADRMSKQQGELIKLQGQLATGVRVLKPSDDPLAMSTAMGAKSAIKTLDSFQSNITYVNNQLSQMDTALGSASDVMSSIKESMLQAGNPTLSAAEREILARDLEGRMDELRGIANRTDPNGNYLFSGTFQDQAPYQVPNPPAVTGSFLEQPTQAAMQAVTGRSIQVSAGRDIDLSITGYDAFNNPNTGNDAFAIMRQAISYLRDPGYPGGQQGATPADTFKKAFDDQRAELDGVFDQVQLARTKVGVRLREAETLEQINSAASLDQEKVAGEAVGLDYAKAISELSQGQLQLQASQQSFASTSQLSLFSFLK